MAVHAVALVELQVKVDVPPVAIVVGFAARVTVGTVDGGGVTAVTVTVVAAVGLSPPAPLQASENVVLAVSAAVV